jgi:hypothetical protein
MEKLLVVIEVDGTNYGARIPVDATINSIIEHLISSRGVQRPRNKNIKAYVSIEFMTPLDQFHPYEGMVIKLDTNTNSSDIDAVNDDQLKNELLRIKESKR